MNCHFHLAAGWLTACRGECMPLQLSALFMWVTVSTYMALYCIFLELWLCGAYKSTVWDTRWLTLWVQWPLPLGFYCVLSRLFSILLSMITVWLETDLKGKKHAQMMLVLLLNFSLHVSLLLSLKRDWSILLRLQADDKQKSDFWYKILRLAYRLYISVEISMPRSRCKDANMQFIRIVLAASSQISKAKDHENGISLQIILNE